MKKRDKTKAYKMSLPKEIMPRRKQKEMYPAFTKAVLEATIREVFASAPPMNSNWHDAWISSQPKTPTESFRFEILDIGSKREVGKEELAKGPKLKLTL
jgi:hypothetical protein